MSGCKLSAVLALLVVASGVAHADAVTVSCDFIEIGAAKGKDVAIDATLPAKVSKRLKKKLFTSQWQVFTALSQTTKSLAKGTAEAITLKQGSMTATLVEVVDKSKIRLTTNISTAKGKKVSTVTSTVEAGDYVINVDSDSDSGSDTGGHMIAITCK